MPRTGRMPLEPALLAALAVLLVPGCGGEEEGSPGAAESTTTAEQAGMAEQAPAQEGARGEREAAAEAARAYLLATYAGDGEQACAMMTPEFRRSLLSRLAEGRPRLAGETCETVLGRLGSPAVDRGQLAPIIRADAVLDGDRAKVSLVLSGQTSRARLERHGERWLVARFVEGGEGAAGHDHGH